MPNFHVHWLVAWRTLDSVPDGVAARRGRDVYGRAARRMGQRVHADLARAGTLNAHDEIVRSIRKRRNGFESDLEAATDAVTCFSAFMLGACGPDFWTLPGGYLKSTSPHHFDLGHYNRTHQQFRISIEALRTAPPGIQADVERSYFLGMATHIAADLVIHQLVNVYAGAYNLLKKDNWSNQGGRLPVKLWNTHNKVEHFWDTFVRYRYLGDLTEHAAVFPGGESGPGKGQLGFPLADTLRVLAEERNWLFRSQLDGVLADEAIKVELEAPLVFPMLACDRLLGEWRPVRGKAPPALRPFLFDRIVDKTSGAYPERDLYEAAGKEAEKTDERGKLEYFSRALNTGVLPNPVTSKQSQNYLTYYVAPDLGVLRHQSNELVWGLNAFYDLPALDRFVDVAVERAARFAKKLAGAYAGSNPAALDELAGFWNLDTGLGLEVQHVPSHTPHEVITRLDFRHILHRDFGEATLGYTRPAAPEPAGGQLRYLKGKAKDATSFSDVKEEAFPVRAPPKKPFPSLSHVQEEGDGRYLDRIRLAVAPAARLVAQEDGAYFDPAKPPPPAPLDLATKRQAERNAVVLRHVRHRLTLELRIPIAELGPTGEEPAAFLYCDDALPVDRPAGADAPAASKSATKEQKKLEKAEQDRAETSKSTHEWMHARAHAPIFFTKAPERAEGGLRYFTARILVNLERDTDHEPARVFTAPTWNNVVPHEASAKFYGRNFAIGTGRRFVLNPIGGGNFDPTTDFSCFDRVSPTEHVFLTVYPLVKTPEGEVVDAFSKEPVDRKKFDEVVRRISGLGWVKVVLLYVLGPHGALQLNRCYVDGLEVPVREVRPEPDAAAR